MKKVIIINKKEGETPLEALEKFRNKNAKNRSIYKDFPMTYAGRLDPMASGILLLLAGDEVKNKEKYLGLTKEYDFQVLFGFSTDTYDILGKIVAKKILNEKDIKNLKIKIKEKVRNFIGNFYQEYPPFSSKTVKGKALFTYALEGKSVDLPKHIVKVDKISIGRSQRIRSEKLLDMIIERISKVKGSFRQEDIMYNWTKEISGDSEETSIKMDKIDFIIINFNIKCSSGTYVRSIANSLGDAVEVPSLAFSIKRTKLGKWSQK